jgi:hypothetical protein
MEPLSPKKLQHWEFDGKPIGLLTLSQAKGEPAAVHPPTPQNWNLINTDFVGCIKKI